VAAGEEDDMNADPELRAGRPGTSLPRDAARGPASPRRPAGGRGANDVAERYRRAVEPAVRGIAGEWPAGTDPALAARQFTASLYGLMAQWHLAPGSFSWPAAAAALAGGPAPGAGNGASRDAPA
jgi:hypothetical protein